MRTRMRCFALCAVLALPLLAQEQVIELEPANTEIHWTVGSTLHTVHGSFKLKSGELRLDPSTGKARGKIVVDVASGESGGDARDRRMHKEILESGKYPEAVFTPDRFEGKLPAEGSARLSVHGMFQIHGADHELTLEIEATRKGDQYAATTRFVVPYIKWGMKNPSNFLLKVEDKVQLEIKTTARVRVPVS